MGVDDNRETPFFGDPSVETRERAVSPLSEINEASQCMAASGLFFGESELPGVFRYPPRVCVVNSTAERDG